MLTKVSVVLPVYNMEKYLEECLDSIINQTLKDIEVICINDGSEDNSLNILKEYAKKDTRINIINQENGGHATATNHGIDIAKGKYLFLMDSDDKLKLDALEKTYIIAEEKNVDFVLFQAINYDDEKNEFYESERYNMTEVADYVNNKIFSSDDLGTLIFKIAVTPWTKLYNRKFIERIHARFPEGLIFDDNIFFWQTLLQAERIYFLREHLFYRRWYESSSTMSGDLRFIDSITINTMVLDLFKKYGKFDKFKIGLCNRKVNLSSLRFMQIKTEFKEIYFDELQKNFRYWVRNNEHYEYLQSILIPRNKFIFESILKSKSAQELQYLIENYDLKIEYENLIKNNNHAKLSKNLTTKEELINKNKELYDKNQKLTDTINNLKQENEKRLSSKSWKLTKPLRILNKHSKRE